jgi:hypothetical protein
MGKCRAWFKPYNLGMINKVKHLVSVKKLNNKYCYEFK